MVTITSDFVRDEQAEGKCNGVVAQAIASVCQVEPTRFVSRLMPTS